MAALIAFDLVLWVVTAGMMCMAFVIKIALMNLHDLTADMACFRISCDMIADFKMFHVTASIYQMVSKVINFKCRS